MRIQPFAFIGGGAESFLAIGGTVSGSFVSASVEYQFHIFSSSGDFEVLRGTNDSVEILLVGAGGSGFNALGSASPGGGGGGVIYTSSINLSKAVYAVNVGTSSLTSVNDISQGSSFLGNSVFFAVSGANDYSGYPQFNSVGAQASNAGQTAYGGGGGAGSNGFSASYGGAYPLKFKGGDGGSGSLVTIKNESFYVAGGGAGGYPNFTDVPGVGGIGGGASAGQNPRQYSGGGGAGELNGGSNATQGATGSVIIQYRTLGYPPYTFTLASGSSEAQACSRYSSGSTGTYYTYVSIIQSGSVVYGPNDYNSLFSGYLSNGTQVYNVVSGAVQAAPVGCQTVYGFTLSSGSTPYAPAACLRFSSGSTAAYYGYTPTIQSGSILYTDDALIITASNGYVASGSGYWQIIDGAPISTSATPCETIYTLTLSGVVTGSAQGACYDSTTATYYALSSSIQSGSLLFTTSSMMSVVGDGYLSNGTGSWQFINGAATTTAPTTCPPILPASPLLVYDFSDIASWPGSGSIVYDLSGNTNTGLLFGTIGSGSADGISFESTASVLECTGSALKTALNFGQQLYVNVQYQTGSFNKLTALASTWGPLGSRADIGYDYFLCVSGSRPETGVQTYICCSAGNGPSGSYDTGLNNTVPTGSTPHNYEMMANIASGSYTISFDNVLTRTESGIAPGRVFNYAGGANGNGMRFGNRTAGENFLGLIKKVVVYGRALSPTERTTINDWMNS